MSPSLIPLLRGQFTETPTDTPAGLGRDELRPAQGIMVGLLVGALLWSALGLVIRYLLRL